MKISDATKTKLAGGVTIILGLFFVVFAVVEIYSGKIEILNKYGGGKIVSGEQPFHFWARIIFEMLSGLLIISGGVILVLNKIPKKWTEKR